jgi:caa(3)-type oxidase subunit IV
MEPANSPATDDHLQHDHHDGPDLWTIAGYMLMLTLASFLTLQMPVTIWKPMTNILFVLTISTCKATLVVAFFMHYKYEKAWKYVVSIPACVVAIVAVCAMLPDVAIGVWDKAPWHP